MSESGLKILVADEDQFVAKLVKTALVKDGFDVDLCHDARQALKSAKNLKYQVLIFSTHLPVRSGPEVAKELRAGGVMTPIILLFGSFELLPRDLPDAVFQLAKPFSIQELRDMISRATDGSP